jgi:hypothetical protein
MRYRDAVRLLTPPSWTPLTLLNGWMNMEGGVPFGYRVVFGVLQLRGSISGGNALQGTPICTLPAGTFRAHSGQIPFPVVYLDEALVMQVGILDINTVGRPAGNVRVGRGHTNGIFIQYVSISAD